MAMMASVWGSSGSGILGAIARMIMTMKAMSRIIPAIMSAFMVMCFPNKKAGRRNGPAFGFSHYSERTQITV